MEKKPWVFAKTQFAPIDCHVALTELLAAIKDRFIPDLEVEADSGYWSSRDVVELQKARKRISDALDQLGESLGKTLLAEETRNDQEALAAIVEHIAERVRHAIGDSNTGRS